MSLIQIIFRGLPVARNNLLGSHSLFMKALACQKSTQDTSSSSSSSSSSDSDEEAAKKTSNTDAVARLNSLLQQMLTEDASKAQESIKLAQPPNKRVKGVEEKQSISTQTVEKQLVSAVKEVADTLGGNTKQTESELLMKLLNPIESPASSGTNLSDILKGMKIEREPQPQQSKAEQVRTVLQKFKTRTASQARPSEQKRPKRLGTPPIEQTQPQQENLFGSEPLGIFFNAPDLKESPQLSTWQRLQERDLKLAVTHPPANYFQEMILWTEQGKLWQFPINNDFGLEEESKVYFADHIFLEQHLEPWCPTRGPLRHFMELVCVGLSKNSYLTVQAKKEHIEWFKNYFEDKKKLLQEVGAIPTPQEFSKKTKTIIGKE